MARGSTLVETGAAITSIMDRVPVLELPPASWMDSSAKGPVLVGWKWSGKFVTAIVPSIHIFISSNAEPR